MSQKRTQNIGPAFIYSLRATHWLHHNIYGIFPAKSCIYQRYVKDLYSTIVSLT